MALSIPAAVRSAIDGMPRPGRWDQAFSVLTVDPDGWSRVCLLSRAELAAGAHRIAMVVTSPSTWTNIELSGRATLVVVDSRAAHYCRLATNRGREKESANTSRFETPTSGGKVPARHPDLHGAVFELDAYKVDEISGIALSPMQFLPTPGLMLDEAWDRSAAVLDSLLGTS